MFLLLQQVMPPPGVAILVSILSRVWFTAAELAPLLMLPLLSRSQTPGEQTTDVEGAATVERERT
jgi:hypothetical protein